MEVVVLRNAAQRPQALATALRTTTGSSSRQHASANLTGSAQTAFTLNLGNASAMSRVEVSVKSIVEVIVIVDRPDPGVRRGVRHLEDWCSSACSTTPKRRQLDNRSTEPKEEEEVAKEEKASATEATEEEKEEREEVPKVERAKEAEQGGGMMSHAGRAAIGAKARCEC